MLNRFLLLACGVIVAFGIFAVPFPDGAVALMCVVILSAGVLALFRRYTEEKDFITMVFLVGLALRLGFGIIVQVFDIREFFGGDAVSYDRSGALLVDIWLGHVIRSPVLSYAN